MPVPLKAGEVLRSRYKIRRIIGHGGMGSIYLADDLRLEGRQCALKEVEHDRTMPTDMLRQASSSSNARRQYSHTWTIPIYPKYPISFP